MANKSLAAGKGSLAATFKSKAWLESIIYIDCFPEGGAAAWKADLGLFSQGHRETWAHRNIATTLISVPEEN